MKTKRILFDIAVLGTGFTHKNHRTGVYRVCEKTLFSCLELGSGYKIYLFSSKKNNSECINYINSIDNNLHLNFINNLKYSYVSFDLYLSPYFELVDYCNFFKKKKKLLIIYDLIQLKFPEWVQENDVKNYMKVLNSIDKNTYILCISNSTKNDLLSEIKWISPEKVEVINLGAENKFTKIYSKKVIQEVLKKYSLPEGKKIFFTLANQNPRKNLQRTIESYIDFLNRNCANDTILVVGGPWGWGNEYSRLLLDKYAKNIFFTGFIDEEDLPIIYSASFAFIFISLYEGFGLPLIEAMRCELPIIGSNNSSLPEIIGESGIMVNPYNIYDIVNAIQVLYKDEAKYMILKEKGIINSQKYTWTNYKLNINKKIVEILEN